MTTSMDKNIPIGKWMIRDVVMVNDNTTILDAAMIMNSNKVGSLLIGDYKNVRGIFTDWDVVKAVASGKDPAAEILRNWMTEKISFLEANVSYKDGISLMVEKRIRHAPVLENGKLVGIVSARDLLKLEYSLLERSFFETREKLGQAQELLDMEADSRIKELLQANEILEAQAFTDALTGLYNHRYFQERLSEEIARSLRHNYPLALIFIDVDNFKNYNDTNGHLMGDYVLRTIGAILRQVSGDNHSVTARLRKSDIVARYGGEEFVVLLPYANSKDGKILAERIRKTIENEYFKFEENQPNKNLTVSLGVSSFPDLASNREEMINFADLALYEAKKNGKNQVQIYKKN
jgi:diguanylate cyclase (GGDEF)-like protein